MLLLLIFWFSKQLSLQGQCKVVSCVARACLRMDHHTSCMQGEGRITVLRSGWWLWWSSLCFWFSYTHFYKYSIWSYSKQIRPVYWMLSIFHYFLQCDSQPALHQFLRLASRAPQSCDTAVSASLRFWDLGISHLGQPRNTSSIAKASS